MPMMMAFDKTYPARTRFMTFGSSRGILFETCIIIKMITRLVLVKSYQSICKNWEFEFVSYIWGLRPAIVADSYMSIGYEL